MYCRFLKNIITNDLLNDISKLLSSIQETNKINLSLPSQICCSNTSTTISSITSNEIERITRSDANQNNVKQANIYITNYNTILKYIKKYNNSILFNSNELLEWHNELFKNTYKQQSCGGKFKTTNNEVIDGDNNFLFYGSDPFEIPILIQELIDWYNSSDLPSLIKIIIFTADFLMIHPFNDGNGRMSRLIMNFLLIKEGFVFFKYISLEQEIFKNKLDYFKSLRSINDNWNTKDCDYSILLKWFINIFKRVAINFVNMFNLVDLYNNKKINKEELIINTIDLLNKDNVSIKRRNIFNYISNLDIKISDQMIKVTLSKLIKNNYLTSENIGKNTQYKITNNFSQLIENIQNKIIKKRITPQSFVIILFVNLYIYKVVSNLCIKNN